MLPALRVESAILASLAPGGKWAADARAPRLTRLDEYLGKDICTSLFSNS